MTPSVIKHIKGKDIPVKWITHLNITEYSNQEFTLIIKPEIKAADNSPILKKKSYPKFGSAKGLVEMSDNFDDPIDGFEEYMP